MGPEISLNFCCRVICLLILVRDFRTFPEFQSPNLVPGCHRAIVWGFASSQGTSASPSRAVPTPREAAAGRSHPGVRDQGVRAPQGGHSRPDAQLPPGPDHRPAGGQRRREDHPHVRAAVTSVLTWELTAGTGRLSPLRVGGCPLSGRVAVPSQGGSRPRMAHIPRGPHPPKAWSRREGLDL